MFNLIKYELKGYYKDFIIVIAAVALANLFLLTKLNNWQGETIFAFSFFITCIAGFTAFLWNIKIFSRDLYSDSGYLLFTTPQRGYSILSAKILTTFIQNTLIAFVCLLFNYLIIIPIRSQFGIFGISKILQFLNIKAIIVSIIFLMIQYAFFLLIVYFSISLGKVTIKNKKFGKLSSFGIFIAISYIMLKISDALVSIFPYSIDISFVISEVEKTMRGHHGVGLNVAGLIFNIIMFIGLFIGTSYILENKIDL